ncbi:MAG: RidA family protein [Hyphomicrobiales bacterium]|jgi:2-iminobutanoate/2-iminopropanoate deaminase|nr:RidA family protein [Hyphomicrobiales bacterium]
MAKRQSVYTESFSHSNPTPMACRVGPLLMSGIINGLEKGSAPGTLDEQLARMFARIPEVMRAAGGTVEQIVKVNVTLADIAARTQVNARWVALFPDETNRPVRHSTQATLDNGKLAQCDIVAWMQD